MTASERFAGGISWIAKAGTVATCFGLLCGLLGKLAWPLELFANFRVQYTVLLAICAFALLLSRQFRWALAATVAAAYCATSIVAHTGWPWPVAAVRESNTFRLVTFNVWFRNQDLARVASYLERTRADVVVLLELSAPRAHVLAQMLPSYPHAHIDTAEHGAVIFSRWPIAEQRFEPLCAGCTRIARVDLDWRGERVTVLGAHLHWPIGPRDSKLRGAELAALTALAHSQTGPTLLGGDFNLTPWSRYFDAFVAGSGLTDCARGQGWKPTWPSAPAALWIRIDQCFASTNWQTRAVMVGPDLGSDHLPNIVDLALTGSVPRSAEH